MRKINEIFYSIQGEGYHSGTPAIFIRFAGCNLKCSFCDTKHDKFTEMSDNEIIDIVKSYPARMVVLTGGEPAMQVDMLFVLALQDAGKYVCIETNGTLPVPDEIDWITCSPKANYPLRVNFDELKIVYTGKVDLREFERKKYKNMYLQPCSEKNTQEVIDYIKDKPCWKLSLQTQKMVEIR